ncbi:MAG: tetratricopeptide repeat protein [Desulfopila sp.]|jgi:tetratricopeptide (TPR) repeat protein|nr:tetratricopeptide repeat protein [Desulfopila sp.]
MKALSRILLFLFAAAFFFLTQGCATSDQPHSSAAAAEPGDDAADFSCSYFYFLWGSNAEYQERYEEALEAYEKAAICDPNALYIAEKIPVLLIQLGRFEEAADWLENYIVDRPDKTVQRFMLARLKIEAGQEDEAIELYREALQAEPDNDNIRLRLGLLYSKKGEYTIAETLFQAILNNNGESYFALLYLARLHAKTGHLNAAEQKYMEALALNWSQELCLEIADFYNLRKQFSKAREMYEQILQKDERDERAALGMVQTYLYLQDAEAALQELSRIRRFSNNFVRLDLIRSQILINIDDNDRAKEILLELLQNEAPAQAYYLLGVIFYQEGDFTKAITHLNTIPPSASEYRDAIMLQVRILEESGRSNQSIDLLEKAIVDREHRLPVFYSWLASLYQNQQNMAKALATLAAGTTVFTEDESLLYEYAVLQEKSGNHEEAMQLMQKILAKNINHADALNFIGYSWADRNIQLQKAYEYITRALEIKPESGYILDSLGWVYYRLGAFEKAEVELLKALELEPNDPYIHEHLGDTYKALGNKEKSRYYYQKSLEFPIDDVTRESITKKLLKLDDN